MRARGIAGCVWLVVFVACSGGGGGSGQASSSSSSSSSSSGSATRTTTCTPMLDVQFFAEAKEVAGAILEDAPCPPGMRARRADFRTAPAEMKRFTMASAFADEHCMPDDAGAADGGAGVDFATDDVVVLYHSDRFGAIPLLEVRGELWFRFRDSQCGGAAPGYVPGYYVVPKSREAKVESCTETCRCGDGPCLYP